ncbi:MAG: redoxin domain-containing protein [Candidatus Obscuribacterales bacterium]|nr:redoxin domain-containing protein [Candidatus Obscuribacterales bacterium]
MKIHPLLWTLAIVLFLNNQPASAVDLKTGDQVPEFTVKNTENQSISMSSLRGQTVLINFFATWCAPCRAELPHLETDIWQRFKNRPFSMLVIGREHKLDEVAPLKNSYKLSMNVCADPDRQIYAKFAEKGIPRNYVIDKNGKIIFASTGYSPEAMLKALEQELGPAGNGSSASGEKSSNPLQIAIGEISSANYSAAINKLNEILKKDGSNAEAHYLLGVSYASSKQFASAESEYQTAIKLANDPKLKQLAELGLAKLHPGKH